MINHGPRDMNLDGTGAPLVDDALYYVQDARTTVGNCGSWWAPKSSGYVCCIDDAGQYTGAFCRKMRETDVPWPVAYVLERTVRHVRVDNQAFCRHDRPHRDVSVEDRREHSGLDCPTCGNDARVEPDEMAPTWEEGRECECAKCGAALVVEADGEVAFLKEREAES